MTIDAAARNNAQWCASVCRSHGIASTFGETNWHTASRSPAYYPDAVTLRADAEPSEFLRHIDTSPNCSVKDSFATLDLTAHGFVELFRAQWIHRPAGGRTPALRAVRATTAAQLSAWHNDSLRPALLDDPSVLGLTFHRGGDVVGGALLNLGPGVVGVSNLFAVEDSEAVWSSSIAAATRQWPDLPLVGYQRGASLAPALANGFTEIGPLVVWHRSVRDAQSQDHRLRFHPKDIDGQFVGGDHRARVRDG